MRVSYSWLLSRPSKPVRGVRVPLPAPEFSQFKLPLVSCCFRGREVYPALDPYHSKSSQFKHPFLLSVKAPYATEKPFH